MSPATQDTVSPAAAHSSASLSSLRSLLLLCVVLPALVFVGAGIYRFGQLRSEAELRVDRALRIAQEHAQKVFDTNEMLLAHMLDLWDLDSDAAVRAREQHLHNQLRAIVRNKPQFQSVWVIGAGGHPLATSNAFPAPAGLDLTDRPYFQWHKAKKGGIFVSELLMGRVTKSPFFDMSQGRYLADGSFAGVATVSLSPAYFASFYATLAADEPGLAFNLLREDGTVFSRWPPLANTPGRLASDSPVMTSIREGRTSGHVTGVSSIDGRERLIMFRKIGDYPIYVGTGMDLSAVRAAWWREMGLLAAFGVPTALGLFLAAYFAARRTREALAAAHRLQQESQARRQVEEALLQAQKLEALGRLTGGVAHDFNNALMVISSNLFLLRRKHPEAGEKYTASIGRAVDSATKLTRQLLAFSRKQPLMPQQVDLAVQLQTLGELISPVLGSGIELSTSVEPGTSPVLVDVAEFELAVLNLAINAKDAMTGPGAFSITARNAAAPLPVPLEGNFVAISVADTGGGIEADVLEKVFEPFFTTKPVGEGTGLGLSQVYGLCRRAGGTATIESVPGRGTTVHMFLPASTLAPGAEAAEQAAMPRHLGKSILLVEDNHDVAGAVRPVLESMGCTVTWLDRAAAARGWLAVQDVLPDLLLTDVVMPGEMDGVALAQHVKAQYPAMKIILMTGYAEQLEAIARQGLEVLPKPCPADVLATAIARATAPV